MEHRTPAIYHGKREILVKLDRIQTKFLNDVGVDEIGVEVGDVEILQGTPLPEVEEHRAPADERLDVARYGAVVEPLREVLIDGREQLPLASGPLQEGAGGGVHT